ncbi:MAG: ribosome biogenesis GTPase Der [Thermodesulfovibrionales bacterium]
MSALVAIIGRPNVGKSSLFNRMIRAGSREASATAITEKTPGVTRDRNYGKTEWEGKGFSVVDTGGFYAEGLPHEDQKIADQVREQALYAIEDADLLLHLLDGKEGLTPADAELASVLRKSGKKVLWVVNKIDAPAKESRALEFYRIGTEEILPVSAITGFGFEELMDRVVSLLPPERLAGETSLEEMLPKVAVVGRPNVGKSTFINALLGKRRLIVSPVPGTTRDAVDSVCTWYGKKYLFIDTAGIRKKVRSPARARRGLPGAAGADTPSIEGFSVLKALRSIERADVVLIVLDVTQGIVEQDQRIAGLAAEYGKSALFLLNKWDLVAQPELSYKMLTQELRNRIWFMDHVPLLTTSGLEKKRITKIFPLIDELIAERNKRVSTGELNRFLAKAVAPHPFPRYRGKELKFFYMTQVEVAPPAFTLVVNYPAAVKESHLRFIEKALREKYSFKGAPLRIYVKPR